MGSYRSAEALNKASKRYTAHGRRDKLHERGDYSKINRNPKNRHERYRLVSMTPPVGTLPDAARRSLPSSPSFENSAPTSIWLPCAMVLLVLALVLWFFRRRFTAHKKPLIPRYHEDEIKPSPLAIEL